MNILCSSIVSIPRDTEYAPFCILVSFKTKEWNKKETKLERFHNSECIFRCPYIVISHKCHSFKQLQFFLLIFWMRWHSCFDCVLCVRLQRACMECSVAIQNLARFTFSLLTQYVNMCVYVYLSFLFPLNTVVHFGAFFFPLVLSPFLEMSWLFFSCKLFCLCLVIYVRWLSFHFSTISLLFRMKNEIVCLFLFALAFD